ncbi:DUF3426 domain-containing protein [Piscinibacter sp.]|uniref:DUF3426 domain-containing protein n=1 Tax=Piscinibacter sp. TaxID=1903157 RepID=UPI002CE3F952|nr:DUF3426 domain-containing protein [Albitalea sp.]HUG24612.1 DUF3426 domain-containing protein [Albitalea sp.]
MSMATRCMACGTIFRVVQDQLKVSEGWVRCGRCDEVFNALEGLFDLERESPPPWQPGGQQPQPDAHLAHDAADLDEDDRIASRFFRPEQEDVAQTPAEAVAERDRMDFADARFEDDDSDGEPPPKTSARSKAKTAAPEFLRAAEREARWRSPRARLSLSMASVLLIVAFALQVGHHFRDLFAAQWPQARPLLAGWCEFAGCRIEAPRRIDDITVESTALNRAAAGTDTFMLSVTLRNRGSLRLALPWIELSLTDGSGELIARRALNPIDFRAANNVMPPGSDTALQLLLSTGTPRVAGYTVEAFYP